MICCKEHPVKAFSLTLVSASEDIPVRRLPCTLHFIIRDSWASRFNDIGSDNNFIEVRPASAIYQTEMSTLREYIPLLSKELEVLLEKLPIYEG